MMVPEEQTIICSQCEFITDFHSCDKHLLSLYCVLALEESLSHQSWIKWGPGPQGVRSKSNEENTEKYTEDNILLGRLPGGLTPPLGVVLGADQAAQTSVSENSVHPNLPAFLFNADSWLSGSKVGLRFWDAEGAAGVQTTLWVVES